MDSMASSEKHDSSWPRRSQPRVIQSEPANKDATADEDFLAACPEEKHPFWYLSNMLRYGSLVQTKAPEHVFAAMNNTTTWQERLALVLMQTLSYLRSPFATVGHIMELSGNTIIVNGGLIRTLFRLIYSALFFFKKGPLVVPVKDSTDYWSFIGMLDPRRALLDLSTSNYHLDTKDADSVDTAASKFIFPGPTGAGDRRVADVMLMASKFAYENEALVKEVVTNSWKMSFVGFYNCWNEYQGRWNKQVFVFTDKAQDANAIVVAWKGTDPFNADDWSTDVDFSWYDLQENTGKVHLGFLEALGLGDRHDMNTFSQVRRNACEKKQKSQEFQLSESTTSSLSPPASGLPQDVIDAPDKILAYDYITELIKDLLQKNPNAKLFITGHSLGGALAMLYAGMLYYFGENFVADRIAAVYTFGQPRVGDQQFCDFMLERLSVERYFRVVYCNDIIPRLPFDDTFFKFKHWGVCFYFSSLFEAQALKEAPNPNFFNIWDFCSIHANAAWELFNSFILRFEHGPEYQESLASLVFRVIALFLPGIGSHSPVNYNNSLRLGRPMPLVAKLSTDRAVLVHKKIYI